jgi:acyl-CoA synthetase (AMP-forming)/AMP-acid ligase II
MEVLPIWEVSTDEEGVLTVRGEALAQGYAVQEAGKWRWEPISAETGLLTRDRVSVWQEGTRRFLRFVGREADTVKILGELVALGPIQEQLDTLRLQLGLTGSDAVVCDVADARQESRLVLVVSQMRTSDAERLQQGLNETLRPFERIHETRVLSSFRAASWAKRLNRRTQGDALRPTSLWEQHHPAA